MMVSQLLVLAAMWAGPMVDGHVHRAVRSGVIAHVGPYHLEVVVRGDSIRVWVLDGAEQVVLPSRVSRLTLRQKPKEITETGGPKDGPTWGPVTLGAKGDHFESGFPEKEVIEGGVVLGAELQIDAKVYKADLRITPLDLRHRLDDTKMSVKQIESVPRRQAPKN